MATAIHNPRLKEGEMHKESVEKAKEAGTQVVDKAKEVVASVGAMAEEAACAVTKKANDLTATAGADIKQWGDSLSESTPQGGLLGHASQAVADTLKESGKYIEDAKFTGIAEDFSDMIQRHPIPAILIGVGIGFCLGRAMRD